MEEYKLFTNEILSEEVSKADSSESEARTLESKTEKKSAELGESIMNIIRERTAIYKRLNETKDETYEEFLERRKDGAIIAKLLDQYEVLIKGLTRKEIFDTTEYIVNHGEPHMLGQAISYLSYPRISIRFTSEELTRLLRSAILAEDQEASAALVKQLICDHMIIYTNQVKTLIKMIPPGDKTAEHTKNFLNFAKLATIHLYDLKKETRPLRQD